MIIKDSFHYVKSNRDTNFTSSLAPGGGSEYEDIVVTGVGDPLKAHITSLILHTATLHPWTISFWATDVVTRRASTFLALSATPYGGGDLLGVVHLETGESWATGTEYVYSTAFVPIHYIDEDYTGELHVGMHNRHATFQKTAVDGTNGANGATGAGQNYVFLRVGMIKAE